MRATGLVRTVRDQISRVGLAEPAFAIYSGLGGLNPRSLAANSAYRRNGAPDGLPIPPANLIFLVAGSTNISWFLTAGKRGAVSIRDALQSNGTPVEEMEAILDFGCGCGRVLRHWNALASTAVYGTDYNQKLVDWCRTNLKFANVQHNELSPPLAYKDQQFDMVYALSVFTHLTEDLQIQWIAELRRVLKDEGSLLITTHGDAYCDRLSALERRAFEDGQLIVKNNTKRPGRNTCSAYHPLSYVRDRLAAGFQLVDFIHEGAQGNPRQDLYVLRKLPAAVPQP